jgi:hypothetical protein
MNCFYNTLLILVSLFGSYSYGQQAARYGGAGFFRIGYANLHQVSKAFSAFTPPSLPSSGNDFVCVGGEGYARLNKYLVGGAGYGMTRRSVSQNSLHADPFSAGGLLQVSRIIVDHRRFWVYPSVGAGFSVIGLTQYELSPTGERQHESTVMLPNVNFHVGIGADWLAVSVDDDDRNGYGGLLLGIRIGYQVSPLLSNWRSDEQTTVQSGPRYATNGYFVTMTIGAGGFIRR